MATGTNNQEVVMRITALWAFTEAGLGGVLHLFKSPFSGLMLCGLSIIFLSMIAKYANYSSRIIIKSLLLVVFIKMLVSPHAGITAYFAVMFQGLLAAFIFGTFKDSTIGLYLFGIIAMVESALQRLIVLTVLFGMQFWDAVNEFGNFIYQMFFTHVPEGNWFLWTIVLLYLAVYAIGGALAVVLFRRITNKLIGLEKTYTENDKLDGKQVPVDFSISKSKTINWSAYFLLGILLVFTIYFSSAIVDWYGVLYILVRTLMVIVIWIYIINPLLLLLLKRILKNRFEIERERARKIQLLFPWIRQILSEAWLRASKGSGFSRFENFLTWTFFFILKK